MATVSLLPKLNDTLLIQHWPRRVLLLVQHTHVCRSVPFLCYDTLECMVERDTYSMVSMYERTTSRVTIIERK